MTSAHEQVRVQELPVTFECEGSTLVGMVHLPNQVRTRGLLVVVAGGPQYRGGVCRMQVTLARQLAATGTPVMRFDHRGLGDSEGQFQGFTAVTADIGAALAAFMKSVPGLREVVLWGGCDAASASMISGWKHPQITGLVLGNPWVHTQETGDLVAVKHFRQRLGDADFWRKVLRLQYNPFPALVTLVRAAWQRVVRQRGMLDAEGAIAADNPHLPFRQRMRLGLSRFRGDVLLLMSGRSLVSKEFDELITSDIAWQDAMRSPRHLVRFDIADADQAFSTGLARMALNRAIECWMHDPKVDLTSQGVAVAG